MQLFTKQAKKIPPQDRRALLNRGPQDPAPEVGPPAPLNELERIRRNDGFLKTELQVSDPNTLALASQTMGPVLDALLDPNQPVLHVTCEGSKRSYRIKKTQDTDLGKLLALGRFLLEHRQPAALHVLTISVLVLQHRLDHPFMGELLRACGEAIQQAEQPDESVLTALQGIAAQWAQQHPASSEVLTLFCPGASAVAPSPAQAARDALLRELGATEAQCRQVQACHQLSSELDQLLSNDPPLLVVVRQVDGSWRYTVPSSQNQANFQRVARVARQLVELGLLRAPALFEVLAATAKNQGETEIELFRGFGPSLCQAPPGFPPELLRQLCRRAGELAGLGALDADGLRDFEWAAGHHGMPDRQILLCQQRIGLDLQRLKKLKDLEQRNRLASRLMVEIQDAHRLMRGHDATNDGAVALMRSLCEIGMKHQAPWLGVVKQALQALMLPSPQ